MTLTLGVGAGILSGMFGIGGGLVIVPVLIMLFKFDVKTAIGTSLFALLLPTGLLGVLEYWRRGEMRGLHGLLIALGLFCGAYGGAKFTGILSASTMKRAYGVFLILVAIYFFWSSSPARSQTPRPAGTGPETVGDTASGPGLSPSSTDRR
ncbi:MAG: sulfite exporter TauE/SafE family protein [Isosphaeraceae bacterium]